MPESRFYSPGGTGIVECRLCPHRCRLKEGMRGICKVRVNHEGKLLLPLAGRITGSAVDPVEKKPLYHFRPGSQILSVGFSGCNLRCPFCQNWHISQSTDDEAPPAFPQELCTAALRSGNPQIAYTYSEPLVHIEYLLSCMEEARGRGIANVLVSNGTVLKEPAKEVLALTDAANIDIKCFSKDTYSRVLGGDLETVLDFVRLAAETGVHTEISTLIVPGLNDSEEELDALGDFIRGLSSDIPWHLSAYHPAWRYREAATEPERIIGAAERAAEKLSFVYAGNIPNGPKRFSDTVCPGCGATLVSRSGFRADTSGLLFSNRQYTCLRCGKTAPIVY
ncbi:MAG: AmmeMemoRadiSam system radical SAM enzyme [Treponema sp.]|jgi:pyruvate formate lyase activating enzyme|nr:AmmeMemoRadiSam system radical SAM enzyme [Treponema sp.]